MNKPFVFVISVTMFAKLHMFIDNKYCGCLYFDTVEEAMESKLDFSRFILGLVK